MNVIKTEIPDVLILEPKVFGDERGFFMETWNEKVFNEIGINANFVQDNHSRSVKNTLRGLHYQIKQPQGKLVRVSQGKVFDVAVDLRADSTTFGKWVGVYLSDDNKHILWVPPGFAHGFLVISTTADFQYKCTEFYAPEYERSLHFADKSLSIEWPMPEKGTLLISEKDKNGKRFVDADYYE